MKGIAKIGNLALAFLIGGGPLMACMLPSNVMTPQEKACCMRMAQRCGDHTMPSTHSCCKTIASPDRDAVVSSSFGPVLHFDFVHAIQPTLTCGKLMRRSFHPAFAFGQSPPESPPPSLDILRI